MCTDYCTCGESFEIKKYVLLTLFFFKIVLAAQGPLRLDRNFRMIFFLMSRKHPWDFERAYIESVGHSGWY